MGRFKSEFFDYLQSSVVILTSSGEVLEASLIDKRGFKSACPGSHNLQAAESWGEAVLTCFLTRAKGALCISWLLSVPAVLGVLTVPFPCRSSAARLRRSPNSCAPSPPSPTWRGLCLRIPVAFLGWYQIWSSWMWMTGNSKEKKKKNRDYTEEELSWTL